MRWLFCNANEEWVKRYSTRIEDHHQPKSKSKREELANIYGEDGLQLLNAVFETSSPDWLRQIPAVEILRRVWIQQYYLDGDRLRWRTSQEIPPASVMISSPYDPDAHYAKKHTTSWVGYKVHLTETCESNQPHLITHVETTSAPITDDQATPAIHESLKSKDLLPSQHIVDTGYLDAELLAITEQQYGVELIGPTRNDYHWQSKAGKGFAAANFSVDWKEQSVTCPEGKTNSSWSIAVDKWGNKVVKIKFASSDCAVCPSLNFCTRSKRKRRTVTLRHQPHYQALQAARQRETTTKFKEEYARRAGIEGTMSEGVRVHHLRRTRYVGLKKTHLQHLMTAVAINFKRLFNWLMGIPLAATRSSRYFQLMTNPITS